MKRIAILGSTGSIGVSALNTVRNLGDIFRVVALSTNSNIKLLEKQANEFNPLYVCVGDINSAKKIRHRINPKIKIMIGDEGLISMVEESFAERVLLAISGSSALTPLIACLESGKDVALANKEALVMAGHLIMDLARRKKVNIFPIDSEQSAIWQCLVARDPGNVRRVYLTASGGPFRGFSKSRLNDISIKEVLRHPRWKMGRKITVDSATLMNKGLEVIEAMFLFGLSPDKIKVLIHPESIIHSMVEFIDGVVMAQLSVTDMRIPIQYALTYPDRLKNPLPSIDFFGLKGLHFERPDLTRFPCLEFAFRAAGQLGTMPAVLNAANEVAVERFLKGKIKFKSIPLIIEKVIRMHRSKTNPGLEDIKIADAWARFEAYKAARKA